MARNPTARKTVNRIKARLERRRSPVSHELADHRRLMALVTEQAMLPRDAFFAPSEMVEPEHAVGRINADIVVPYPPGIPVLAPGEVITEAIAGHLEHVVALGGFVEGATDQALDRFRVVA